MAALLADLEKIKDFSGSTEFIKARISHLRDSILDYTKNNTSLDKTDLAILKQEAETLNNVLIRLSETHAHISNLNDKLNKAGAADDKLLWMYRGVQNIKVRTSEVAHYTSRGYKVGMAAKVKRTA